MSRDQTKQTTKAGKKMQTVESGNIDFLKIKRFTFNLNVSRLIEHKNLFISSYVNILVSGGNPIFNHHHPKISEIAKLLLHYNRNNNTIKNFQ